MYVCVRVTPELSNQKQCVCVYIGYYIRTYIYNIYKLTIVSSSILFRVYSEMNPGRAGAVQ